MKEEDKSDLKSLTLLNELKSIKESDLIYVQELKTYLRYCCYQTYRLYERYCICGRVIPQDPLEKENIFI